MYPNIIVISSGFTLLKLGNKIAEKETKGTNVKSLELHLL